MNPTAIITPVKYNYICPTDNDPQYNEAKAMTLRIGDHAPDFTADTTEGLINFYEWTGDNWTVLFSHPKDFTPVCTTELGAVARLKRDFDRLGVKVIGLSVDDVEDHNRWAQDIADTQGVAPNYPLIGDPGLEVAKLYGMLPATATAKVNGASRTAVDNATVRSIFIIGPDKIIKTIICYPMSTGRNFDEVLRVIESLQVTSQHNVATPADWQPGDFVIIAPSLTDEEAKQQFPYGWTTQKPYLRLVPQPFP